MKGLQDIQVRRLGNRGGGESEIEEKNEVKRIF